MFGGRVVVVDEVVDVDVGIVFGILVVGVVVDEMV